MKKARYAENTTVSPEKSQVELIALLRKNGATECGLMQCEEGSIRIVFAIAGRRVRICVEFETPDLLQQKVASQRWSEQPRGWYGWSHDRQRKWAEDQSRQQEMQRWRGLILIVKSKFEMIAMGQTTLEREFLADVLLPDGSTVYESVRWHIDQAYVTGEQPELLGSGR